MNSLTKIISVLGLSTMGCVQQPYTDVRLAYANGHHKKDLGGGVDMLCIKARGGAKAEGEKTKEFRLGVDVCHGKLPYEKSLKTYNVDLPVVGSKETHVYEVTSRSLVRIGLPFLEYRYGSLEANIPSQFPADIGIRSSRTKDISLGMWAALGYEIDFTVSKTDYYLFSGVLNGGMLNNIPGIDVKGRFYGELTNEAVLFGKVPLGMSVRVDKNGEVTPLFSGGYRIEW